MSTEAKIAAAIGSVITAVLLFLYVSRDTNEYEMKEQEPSICPYLAASADQGDRDAFRSWKELCT